MGNRKIKNAFLLLTILLLLLLPVAQAEALIELTSPDAEEVVVIIPKQVQRYLNLIHKDHSVSSDQCSSGLGKSIPVDLTWESAESDTSYRVEISQDANMSNSEVYQVEYSELSLVNLLSGTTYYWKVEAADGDASEISSFTTAPYTRWITAKNMFNIRDIGGYHTTDGEIVKQGMLIRGGEIRSKSFNEDAKHVFADTLGIKTEIDLRFCSI